MPVHFFQLYNFLNRSAQSLGRTNSQGGRARRVKDLKESLLQPIITNSTKSGLDTKSSLASRLPLPNASGSLPGRSQGKFSSISPSRSARLSPKHTLNAPGVNINTTSTAVQASAAYSYNTPPQTPSKYRTSRPNSPQSPTSPLSLKGTRSGTVDLLLKRPIARPITPSNSNSSTSRKVFGLLHLPSPSKKTAIIKEDIEGAGKKRGSGQSHKLRQGSDSSNEPLIHSRTHTSDSSPLSGSTSTGTDPSPRSVSRLGVPGASEEPSSPPSSPTPISRRHRQDDSPPSRKGTPRLDFLFSVTPRASSVQGDRNRESGKEKGRSSGTDSERNTLHHPRARAPASFLGPVPLLQRTPPTPKKDELRDTRVSPRVDSFMSDSMPLPNPLPPLPNGLALSANGNKTALERSPAFASLGGNGIFDKEKLRKDTLGLGASIERSRSAPAVRGRMSPCLRIPSPKFLNRDRERSKSREGEKDGEVSKDSRRDHKEKRRVTPESVGAPILRDQHSRTGNQHNHHHHHHHHHHGQSQHGHTNGTVNPHARTQPHAVGCNRGGERAQGKTNKAAATQVRRTALPSFDFERPGSRSSSNGQTESRGTRSDDEGSNGNSNSRTDKSGEHPKAGAGSGVKASSPVPPLPTRVKPRSPAPPPPRPLSPASPSAASHSHSQAHSHAHTNGNNAHVHDDSALPRLNSSLTRRTSYNRVQRPQGKTNMALPVFSFERAAPSPPPSYKPARDIGGGQYVDTQTGLIMWASGRGGDKKQANGFSVIPEENSSLNSHAHSHVRSQSRSPNPSPGKVGGGSITRTSANSAVSSKALEEATAVLSQFKNALDDAGFATLQKCEHHLSDLD